MSAAKTVYFFNGEMLNLLNGILVQLWLPVSWLIHWSARWLLRKWISLDVSDYVFSNGSYVHAVPPNDWIEYILKCFQSKRSLVYNGDSLLTGRPRQQKINTPQSPRLRTTIPAAITVYQGGFGFHGTDSPAIMLQVSGIKRKPVKAGYPLGWWLGAVGLEPNAKTKALEQNLILYYSEFKWAICVVVPQRLQPVSHCSNDPLLWGSL